jgi:DNA-binding transcriptional MocR family regulator
VHRLVERGDPRSSLLDLSLSVLPDAGRVPAACLATSDLLGSIPATGYSPWGLPELRRSVAEHITWWGLETSEDQVIITTGAQQAISVAAACWVRPGDTVVVDDPTYPGALATFVAAGARLEGVPMDRNGVLPEALVASLCRRPALVYLQTGVHSPTGTVLSESRRQRIAIALSQCSVPVVEDLALCDLGWSSSPRPLAADVPGASTTVVGSLSKLFWGGLRIGFVRAPEPLSLRLARIKATHDLGSSVVSQMLAHRLLRSRPPQELRDHQTVELRRRYEVLAAALRRRLPRWTWKEPSGGLSIWVDIMGSGETFAQHAMRYGVAVASPVALSLSPAHGNRLRLSFASAPDELEEAVDHLAAANRTWNG